MPSAPATRLYRTVWRWHFYAGLIVLPVLAWLAGTGALYLYKPEIERAWYARWVEVVPAGRPLPLGTLVARVGAAAGGRVTQLARPAAANESWRASVTSPGGAKRMAFVDPYRGTVLGLTRPGGMMGLVKELHSLALTGPVGNALVEIVAGWAIVLVTTGVYLWWPRGAAPALGVRGGPSRRTFWRDLHASLGVVAGGVILFLAVTGMPWTGVWGKTVQAYVGSHALGRPPAPGGAGGGHAHHETAETLPWSLARAPMPLGHAGSDVGPDRAFAAAGLPPPWTLSLPAKPGAPYLFSATAVRAEDARAIYVDARTGHVLRDAAYPRFGAGARWIEWGIATHQGQEYGEPNRLLMLFGCVSLLLLAITAPAMWLMRRPRGRLGAPPRGGGAGVVALMLGIGVLFPLTGLSMLAALLGEGMWARVTASGSRTSFPA